MVSAFFLERLIYIYKVSNCMLIQVIFFKKKKLFNFVYFNLEIFEIYIYMFCDPVFFYFFYFFILYFIFC